MGDIKKELVSGVAYTAVAKYSGLIISLIVTAILSRLLLPEEFGIVAIATVIIAFFVIFCDLGIMPAIIQNQDLDEKDLSNIFSFTIWMGLFLTALFFFSAGPIANYYDKPILIPICRILSVNLFFASIVIVPNALIMKNKKFKFIAYRTLIIQCTAGAISIIAALSGAGVYALLINPVATSIFLFIASYIKYPQRFRFTLGLSSLKKIFSYSLYMFLFNVINYFSRNLDKLTIGKYLGMEPLGYYEKSYRLMMLPLQNITHIVTPVMHPVLAKFQNDLGYLSSSYLKIVRLLSFIGFPLTIFLFFTSSELILLLFGDQWIPAVESFKILSLSVGFQVVLSTSGSIFQAANSTKTLFWSGMLSTTVTIIGLLVGIFVFKTIEGVSFCILLSFLINFFQSYLLLFRVTLKTSMAPFFRQFLSPLLLSLILAVPLFGADYFLSGENFILPLVIKSLLFITIWVLYMQYSSELDIFGKIRSIVKKNR